MAENKLLEPGQKVKPNIESNEVIRVAQDKFQIKVKTISELDSYDDRNYLITTNNDKKFVFKISNFLDSSSPGLIGMLNCIIKLLIK